MDMDYEVLNVGRTTVSPYVANPVCPSVNGICPGVNGYCPGGNKVCPGTNSSCGGTDKNCPNVFPCANPGFGCRSGCGGSKYTNCAVPYSLQQK